MKTLFIELADESEQEAFGAAFGRLLQPGMKVYLSGDLGAGKTTLARGVLRGMGYNGKVKSPTYTLLESYALHGYQVHHLDLYRLADPEELEFLGLRDLLDASIWLLEWPEKGQGWLPQADINIQIALSPRGRVLHLEAASKLAQAQENKLAELIAQVKAEKE